MDTARLRNALALFAINFLFVLSAFSQSSNPVISTIDPATAVAGTQVTISGSGFGATQGGGNVWLGSTYGNVVTWSDTQVVATVASGSKSGVAQILQGGVWSNTVNLTVITPNVTNVTPASAVAGTQVTITGTGFGASQGSGNLWLGSTYGVIVSWSDTQIVATVASGSRSGVAQVLQGGVWSNPVDFVVVTPNITGVTPTAAVAGTQVTIAGTGFGANQGGGNVWLGSTYGIVSSWSDTQVVALVAAGAQSGVAQILQGGVWSNAVNFTVITPNIVSVTPTTAVAGTQITISGSGFGATQGSGNVWLGSTYGVVVSWSDAQIVATVASGSKSGVAQVLQGGVWSNTINFTVVTPNITNVTPTSAVAGMQITITGSGFGATQGSGNVWLGSTYGTVVSWSDSQVVAAVANGAKSGVAQIFQGGVWSNPVDLTIITPNITSVTPTSAVVGTQITVSGTGFGANQGNGNVWLGSTYGVIVSWSDTQIVASVASGSKSGVAQVLQGGVWSNTVDLTVITPNIASVNPTTAPAGAQITITGTGFGAAQGSGNVWLGSTYGVISSWSDTQIVATVAVGASSGVAQVLQGGVWSNTVNFTVGSAGYLAGRLQITPWNYPQPQYQPVNLSDPEVLDWVHWGLNDTGSIDRKAGANIIGSLTILGADSPQRYTGCFNDFSWTNGDVNPTVPVACAGIELFGVGEGFQLTVPADTTPRTLKLYVGADGATEKLQAQLSDNSAPAYVDTSFTTDQDEAGTYVIDFQAASPKQTLTVTYTMQDLEWGDITIEAAVLTPKHPDVTIVQPAADQSFTGPASFLTSAKASEESAPISVSVLQNGYSLLTLPDPPFDFYFSSLEPGNYQISAVAANANGLSQTSQVVPIHVIGGGGELSASVAASPASVDLTQQGTGDWILLGRDVNITADRKANVAPLIDSVPEQQDSLPAPTIGPVTLINWAYTYWWSDNRFVTFSAEDGTQQFTPVNSGFYFPNAGSGLEFGIDAGTAERTATVYVAAVGAQGKFEAYLSDGSAPIFVDTSADSQASGNVVNRVYTLRFHAATDGQKLIVRYNMVNNYGYGGVVVNAVTVNGPPVKAATIRSLSRDPVAQGALESIAGIGFGSQQGAVFLNTSPIETVSWTDTQIVFVVPADTNLGSASLQVETASAVQSNTVALSVVARPLITSISPGDGPVGAQVTITGSGFGATQGAGSLLLGTLNGVIVSWSDTQILATIASGSYSGVAKVTTDGLSSNSVPFKVDTPAAFSVVATLNTARFSHTATLLNSGKVLITGGYDTNYHALSSTEIYDPVARSFVVSAPLNIERVLHTATLLNDGKVLIVGGHDVNWYTIDIAELFDPATQTFTVIGKENSGRYSHTATMLASGKVLIVGGYDTNGRALASAEIYDPVTKTFTSTGSLTTARANHSATLLSDGTVLIAGGQNDTTVALATAELYDPNTGAFRPIANLNVARNSHAATLLNNGSVLVAGGFQNYGYMPVPATELYNSAAGTFSASAALLTPRGGDTGTLLNDGRLLFIGGLDSNSDAIAGAELYDPSAQSLSTTATLAVPRAFHSATLLGDGTVLVVGGQDESLNAVGAGELYQFPDTSMPGLVSIAVSPADPTLSQATTQHLVAIGTFADQTTQTLSSVIWNSSASTTATVSGDATNSGNLFAALPGSTTVSACVASICGSTAVTVTQASLTSLSVTPASTLIPTGKSQQLFATGTFSGGGTEDLTGLVTWSSNDTSVATVTNVGAATGGTPGNAIVTATYGNVAATANVTITPPLISISISPQNFYLGVGATEQFTATGNYADNSTRDLTSQVVWRATGGATINSQGQASAFAQGNAIITATASGVMASVQVTITASQIVSLALSPQSLSVNVGVYNAFNAVATYTNGSTQNLTTGVTWTSSNPAVASVSSGFVTGVAEGTATITASFGQLTASAPVTVNGFQSISISPQSRSIPLGMTASFFATGNYADGTNKDISSSVTWSSSDPAVGTINSSGLFTPLSQGTTTLTANVAGLTSSSTVTVTAATLVSFVITPENPVVVPGATVQFSALGTYSDGTTQDVTGAVNWSSSSAGTVSINPNGVATAASSGTATVTAISGAVASATNITVTSGGPPTITASLSPAPNANGWNNSNVTVTFTCTPGSATITSCPNPQIVSSEGPSQVVSGTVTDAAGNTASTSVTLNIDKTPPTLQISTPNDGDVFSTSVIGVTGSVSDSLSGLSAIECNGSAIAPDEMDFSCAVSIDPGVSVVVVRAVDVAGNVNLIKLHVTLNAPLSVPNSIRITPAHVTLSVGSTQQFTAVDEQGRPRSDATWAVSDSTLATLTSGGSPTLTALAAGRVTLIATTEGLSAEVPITISTGPLSPGTSQWSLENSPGLFTSYVYPAVPSGPGMPGMYSVQDSGGNGTAIVAFTRDGQQMWQTPLLFAPVTLPSTTGDLIVGSGGSVNGGNSQGTVTSFDGQTGKPVWQSSGGASPAALRPDGGIVAISTTNNQSFVSVLNGATGQPIAQIPLQSGISKGYIFNRDPLACEGYSQNESIKIPASPSSVTVDADGKTYIEYGVLNSNWKISLQCVFNAELNQMVPYRLVNHEDDASEVRLLTIYEDGSSSEQTLNSDKAATTEIETFLDTGIDYQGSYQGLWANPLRAIPDGQGGFLAAWYEGVNGSSVTTSMMTHQSPSGSGTYQIPVELPDQFVLSDNGVVFATKAIRPNGAYAQTVSAFDMSTGNPLWSYQAPDATGKTVEIQAATDDGGVLLGLEHTDGSAQPVGIMDMVHVDSKGVPTTVATLPTFDPVYDWNGQWYAVLGSGWSSTGVAVSLPVMADFLSAWPMVLGDPLSTNVALDSYFGFLKSCPLAVTPCPKEAIYAALGALENDLATDCQGCQENVFNKLKTANGEPLSQSTFLQYLQKNTPQLFDGTTTAAKVCGTLADCSTIIDNQSVAHRFALSGTELSAATVTPSKPQRTFFRPSCITTDNGGANPVNMSAEFHEALHGVTGLDDTGLQLALGCKKQDDSSNISWYLRQFIDGTPASGIKSCSQAVTLACGQ